MRIVLSGVARTQARFACGKNAHRADALRLGLGEVEEAAAGPLETFGLLAHLTQPEAATLIDALIGGRLLGADASWTVFAPWCD